MKRMIELSVVVALLLTACDDDPPTGMDDDDLDVDLIAEGLTAPVALMEPPDASNRLFVVDQTGRIRIIDATGTLQSAPFLDLTSAIVQLNPDFDERGLLGLAFHPQYATNGRFYVYYSSPVRAGTPADYNHTAVISEFRVSAGDANRADIASERVLLQIPEPQFNHNGGTLAFGPDGFLYISLGDGGGGDDNGMGHVADWYGANDGGNGQDVEANLLGSILRIDVNSGNPYGIPADNPFVGEDGLDEIYAYGFRNPYRMSFDAGGTGMLLVGDAGQELFEEVSVVTNGGNYGWNVKEGTHCFNTNDPETPRASCPDVGEFGEPLIDPVIEYDNAKDGSGVGIVVVGGYVYRGSDVPDLAGRYIFGDYSTSFDAAGGQVFAATVSGSGPWSFEELRFGSTDSRLNAYVLGFGQDNEGEVYVLTSETGTPSGTTGRVWRLVMS
jgi:glucose/arabinose dehydrogenase